MLNNALLAPKAINVVMRLENPGSAQRPIPCVVFQMLAAMQLYIFEILDRIEHAVLIEQPASGVISAKSVQSEFL